MDLKIPYGRSYMEVEVPDGRIAAVLEESAQESGSCGQQAGTSEHERSLDGQKAAVRSALAHPIGSERLSKMAQGKRSILVITSDHTRPLPSRITLPLFLDEIRAGAPDADIRILVATGMHRSPTRAEMEDKFGAEVLDRENFIIHHSERDEDLALYGILPSGGELWLNKLVSWAELIVAEGFIEPHFFAGFSGGRKSILPGIAGRKTVMYNHNALFIADKNARAGSLDENPIHKDMIFASHQAGLAFILNVLLDDRKRITAAFAGDPEEAHLAGCRLCASQAGRKAVTADIAITSNGGYPLDQNIYQCVKGMSTAEACVREGGVIILCGGAEDGHGGEAFYHYMADRATPEEVERDILGVPPEETRPDQWQGQILARIMKKAHCIFVSSEKNKDTLEAMHFIWAGDLKSAMSIAESFVGSESSVCVIPNGVGIIAK